MIRVISANLNGIRASARKGFFCWLKSQNADLVCVQELKAQESDLLANCITPVESLKGWFQYAKKKGYSGVGIYSRNDPDQILSSFGVNEFDEEGRYIALRFGNLVIISAYFPSGSSSEQRQAVKFRFMSLIYVHLKSLIDSGYQVILCGDVNIAHKEIDIKNWRGNVKNSGFLPEERAWLTKLFHATQYVDVFRLLDSRPDQFTWWSQRGQAYTKNVGWRIDYQIASIGLAAKAIRCEIYKEERFSDHAPVIIDYDFDINDYRLK